MKKYLYGTAIFVLLLCASFAMSLIANNHLVEADSSSNRPLHGWAWSSNIGWISFNSADPGAGGGPYKAYMSLSGNMAGHAWSPNIGWISFDSTDITDCNGGNNSRAHIDESSGRVTGWIRAIAGKNRTDGWDGCIELSGTNHVTGDITGNGGVTLDPKTGVFKGYAWGGPVVGWIQFNPTKDINKDVVITTGGGGFIPYCVGTSDSDGYITYSVTVSGSGTYQYSWNGTAFTTNSTYTDGKAYDTGTVGVIPSLVVRDAADNTLLANATCPAVPSGKNVGKDMSLLIGSTQATASLHETSAQAFRVRQGQGFALVRNIKLDTDAYRCAAGIDKEGVWDSWMNISPLAGDIDISTLIDGTVTRNNVTGTYGFSITCYSSDPAVYPDEDYPATTSKAYLKIVNSSEGER